MVTFNSEIHTVEWYIDLYAICDKSKSQMAIYLDISRPTLRNWELKLFGEVFNSFTHVPSNIVPGEKNDKIASFTKLTNVKSDQILIPSLAKMESYVLFQSQSDLASENVKYFAKPVKGKIQLQIDASKLRRFLDLMREVIESH